MQFYIGVACILAAAVSWGFIGSVSKFALAEGITPMEIAFWRMVVASFFFLAHAARLRACKLHSIKDFIGISIFGVVSIACLFSAHFAVVKIGGAAIAAVLLYTAPAWVALFAWFFYKEKMTIRKTCAISLSLFGVVLISFSGGSIGQSTPILAILLGLLTGLLYATHYVVTKVYLIRYTPLTLYGFAMLAGAIGLFPFVEFAPKTLTAWLTFLVLGFVTGYIAYWVYSEGMRRLPLTKAAVLATLEPVLATIIAWFMWGESFSFTGWVGAGLVITAVFVLMLDKKQDA